MTPTLRELQLDFAAGIFEDQPAVHAYIHDGRYSAARLLRVYRHNSTTSLTAALAAVFPVVRRLVGEGFFDYAADRHWRTHPPRSGNIHDFGNSFPDFLERFEPARDLVYLPDVARLEWAWHRAFHSPDPGTLELESLTDIEPSRYGELRFRVHPSAALLQSPWPVQHIWEAHQGSGEPEPVDLQSGAEQMLVIRRGLEVAVERLAPGEYVFLSALTEAQPFAAACEMALARQPDIDLAALLQRHVCQATLVGLITDRLSSKPPSGESP